MERFARALEAPDADKFLHVSQSPASSLATASTTTLSSRSPRLCRVARRRSLPGHGRQPHRSRQYFLAMNDFDLATKYFERARDAGAADQVVSIGLANAYLAQGEPLRPRANSLRLASRPSTNDNYDYMLALATSIVSVTRTFAPSLRSLAPTKWRVRTMSLRSSCRKSPAKRECALTRSSASAPTSA